MQKKNQIFVALTADENLWDKSKEVILLGDWCINNLYKKDEYRVLSYPIKLNDNNYNDFEKFNYSLYSEYLKIFTKLLNNVHDTKHSERYWDILIGSFLYRYIGIMYERYLTIEQLLNQFDQFDCATVDLSEYQTQVYDELDFMDLIQTDDYNLEIYSKILSFFKIDSKKTKKIQNKPLRVNTKNYLKNISEFFLNLLAFFKISNKTVFLKNSYLDFHSTVKLILLSKYKVKVKFQENYNVKPKNYNLKARKNFQNFLPDNNEFKIFLNTVLPFDLPLSIIENYQNINYLSKKHYPKKNPEIIMSANSWYYDELFKSWAARANFESKLLGVQHGGNYGVSKYLLEEKYEAKITNFYITWGWSKNSNNIIPFGSSKMINYSESRLNSDEILFVMTSRPKYFCDLRYLPLERAVSFESQKIFLENISKDLLKNFRIRPYPSRDKNQYIDLWKFYNRDIIIDDWNKKFTDSLNNCKLYVTDHLMTTYVESIKMNVPTIIFLNKDYPGVQFNNFASKEFKKLEEVGMLFYSSKDAAIAINQMQNNINEWWFDDRVQKVRKEFCSKFAKTPNRTVSDFDSLFDKVLS